jgi:hypothetical protein
MISLRTESVSDLEFYATRFVDHWYRGEAHLNRDITRFVSTYRVPDRDRRAFRDAVRTALASAPMIRRAG